MKQPRDHGLLTATLRGKGRTLPTVLANLGEIARVTRHAKRDLTSTRITVSAEEGDGYREITCIRGNIYVEIANVEYRNRRDDLIPGEGFVNFLFKISGDRFIDVGQTAPLRWNGPSLLMWSQPVGISSREWLAPRARERYVAICVRPEFLIEHFFMVDSEVPEPFRDLLSNRREKLSYRQWPLDAQTFELATKLINNPYIGALALIHMEAIVLELLCAALGRLCLAKEASIEQFTEHELRCLHAARSMLIRQFAPVPTIARLARAVGMSQTALTKGFKSLFRETIFEFSLHCRMTHALTLMRDQGWSVERAAEAIGYAHPTSFATAFRRYFDVRPIDLRCGRLPPSLQTASAMPPLSPTRALSSP